MGKKLIKKGLPILILLLASILVFAACKNKKPTNEVDDTTETDYLNGPTEEINLSEYTLIRSDRAPAALVSLGANFKEELDRAAGGKVTLSDDFLAKGKTPDENAKEILIGNTNRPESNTVYEELGDAFSYRIQKVGNKLVIAAPTPELMGKAINYLMETYVLRSGGNGKFLIKENLEYQSEAFSYLEIVNAYGDPQYQIIRGQKASAKMAASAIRIHTAISKRSSTEPVLTTDWIRAGQQYDLSVKSIIIGDTEYARCRELRGETSYFEWYMEQMGNQIYLYGMDENSVELVCSRLLDKIEAGCYMNGSKAIRILTFDAERGFSAEWTRGIPAYEGGTLESIREFATNHFRIDLTGTTKAEYDAYLAKLGADGFRQYAANSLGDNTYVTFRSEQIMVHAYYLPKNHETRVLVSPADASVKYPVAEDIGTAVATPSVTLMDMDYESQSVGAAHGAGFIFTLSDGSYILIDGGLHEDTEKLYQYLADNNKREDGKILIRAWLITHPHGDHYYNFLNFTSKYATNVTLEYFIAQFDTGFREENKGTIAEIENCIGNYRGAKYIVPLAGQKMVFGNLEMEFFFTAEMLWPTVNNEGNSQSLVCRVNFCENTFFLTGDIEADAIKVLNNLYGNAMHCDFLQLPHHGHNNGLVYNSFYAFVDPAYVFFNTSKEGAATRISTSASLTYLLNSLHVQKYFIADGGYTVIDLAHPGEETLPDLPGNIERTYVLANYSEQQDHILWEAFTE